MVSVESYIEDDKVHIVVYRNGILENDFVANSLYDALMIYSCYEPIDLEDIEDVDN